MYKMYINKVLFPVTPGKITIKVNGNNKTINLIDQGEVNLLKTPGLSDITIDELLLPVHTYPFSQPETKARPAYYMDKLNAWINKKKPVQFKIVRYELSAGELLWNTDMDVSIEDYEIIEDAENYGRDVCIKLNMKQYRHWGTKKLVPKKGKSGNKVTVKKSRKSTKSIPKTYKVKSGDTLMKIAKSQLGDSSKRTKIYELNKKTIESAAKKHGRKSSSCGTYLYVGTVLKLPGGSS